jgi:hypothetical protein
MCDARRHHAQALCILDTAAAFSLLPGSAFLFRAEPAAAAELLREDLRRRLVANRLTAGGSSSSGSGSSSIQGPVHCRLRDHPAVAAAAPAPGDGDELLLPWSAAYRCCSSSQQQPPPPPEQQQQQAADAPPPVVCRPFQHLVAHATSAAAAAAARPQAPAGAAATTPATATDGPSLFKRAAWRRQLSRQCSHYLAPLLGAEDAGGGCVLLTGGALAAAVKGLHAHAAGSHGDAQHSASSSSSSSSSSHTLAFVGYESAAAAQAALDGCVAEVLSRCAARCAPLRRASDGAAGVA